MDRTTRRGITRRRFLQGVGAAGGLVIARPLLPHFAFASDIGLDDAPFEYGVASADPLPDRVVLWTWVSAPHTSVEWEVALADDPAVPDFSPAKIVASGTAGVDPARDRTVWVDVTLPEPGRHYWYRFEAPDGSRSVAGRTKTAPAPGADPSRVRLAVASCQDFQAGYYHAWQHLAAQDLDAVLFLGDYIYEYADDGDGFRPHDPLHEIVALDDYRRRYRNYRSDRWLREAHRLHPFIAVWDDHEVANDRWGEPPPGGAENHSPGQGDYADRLAAATQAYFEWVPGRPQALPIYRTLSYGRLAEIICLDTRSYRHEPVGDFFNPVSNTNPAISDPSRTMLGATQKQWFKDRLEGSAARWKLIGNQVMFGHLSFGMLPDEAASVLADLTGQFLPNQVPRDGIPVNADQWDGYQPERREILEFIRNPGGDADRLERAFGHPDRIRDVVFLTGDIHTSWAMELYPNPGNIGAEAPVAVEFVGPSISSFNLNELLGDLTIGRPLPHRSSAPVEALAIAGNPHVRYVELDSNGYILVDVTEGRTRADFFHVSGDLTDLDRQPVEQPGAAVDPALGGSWLVESGSTRLAPAGS